MIPHIEISSMFPCLHISFSVYILLSTLVTLIVYNCYTNFISFPFTDNIKKTRMDVYIVAQNLSILKMLLIVSDNYDVYNLTAKELEYIPKIILLREFKNYIDQLWDIQAHKG